MYGAIYQLFTGRSGKWPKVRDEHLEANPRCVACGQLATEVHHVKPFKIAPALELDPSNLASVCEHCHLAVGHGCNWKKWNIDFWRTARTLLAGIRGPVGEVE